MLEICIFAYLLYILCHTKIIFAKPLFMIELIICNLFISYKSKYNVIKRNRKYLIALNKTMKSTKALIISNENTKQLSHKHLNAKSL